MARGRGARRRRNRRTARREPFFARRPAAATPFFQARPVVQQPGDAAEAEADRVAARVAATGQAPPVRQVRAGGGGALVARAPLDLDRLDRELFWGQRLTQRQGRIGYGAKKGKTMAPPVQDRSQKMEISAEVFPNNTRRHGPAAPAPGTTPTGRPGGAGGSDDMADNETDPPPSPTPSERTVDGPRDRSRWRLSHRGLLEPARRALVVGGIHGDERGPLDVMRQLRSELAAGTAPLARDFDTIVIPEMNPGGVADKTRTNRRRVDLNRNFPGIAGFPPPAPTAKIPPRQPEVRAVMRVVKALKPDRILALHAIGSHSKGGVYADPVEGAARELACRMALRMRGAPRSKGGMSGDVNVRGNLVEHGVCSARYPGKVTVTTAQSSLGAWGAASTAAGGAGGIPVITHEVAGKGKLAASGRGRSVDTIMPGIREFLLDNERQQSEADELLRRSVTEAFLKGTTTRPQGTRLRKAIVKLVQARFGDLAQNYEKVWLPSQPQAVQTKLPTKLTIDSHYRSFTTQGSITRGHLAKQALFRKANTDSEIKQAIRNVLRTVSVPGFSRHPWGTEIDVIDADSKRWKPGHKKTLAPLIPFLETTAPRFGFYHPYSGKPPRPQDPHYQHEPWHISYAPIARVLQAEWESRFTGQVLQQLIQETARAVASRGVSASRLETILAGMGLEHHQSNVASPP